MTIVITDFLFRRQVLTIEIFCFCFFSLLILRLLLLTHSPDLRRPFVNCSNLSKHRKNLPDPELFAIQSAPEDPAFYSTKYKSVAEHRSGLSWIPKECGLWMCTICTGFQQPVWPDDGHGCHCYVKGAGPWILLGGPIIFFYFGEA